MTSTATSRDATAGARVAQVDLKLEVIPIPVSDLDRAKAFYENLGWRLDADFRHDGDRAIQLTPPGSRCSIHFNPKVRRDLPRACSWSSPTSTLRATT